MAVKAVSVNPVDTKVRMRPPAAGAPPNILGHDAAGVVEAVGAEVSLSGAAQLSPINAANLRQAHAQIESGSSIGKVVVHGR